MKRKILSIMVVLIIIASASYPLSITVAPSSGTPGGNPTTTIADAITQINAGADADNTIVLRNTEGAHVLPAMTTWTFNAGKNCTFNAEAGQPVIVLTWTTGRYMLTINAGATETLTFNNIGFVPQTGLTYAGNVADGFNAATGNYVFTNCVFSFNDGANGVGSQEGDTAFTGTNCVGDDWIQFNGPGNASFHNCTVTGCQDDAILIGNTASTGQTLLLDQGTCIANVGGAGIQVFDKYVTVTMDGAAGRVLIANTGQRSGADDVGVKFFWDAGCQFNMTLADIITTTNAGFYDFEGVPTINITDSRIAFCNSRNATPGGIFCVWDSSADSAYSQAINLTRVTFHDCQGTAPENRIFYYEDGAAQPQPTYTIRDSIFSGAGNTFDMLNAGTVAVNQSHCAVVTAGAYAVGAVGDMGAGSVSADPNYKSLTYTIGRGQANPDFLYPQATEYQTAASWEGVLRGGAPVATAVGDWTLYSE